MKLLLERVVLSEKSTIGNLYIDGVFFCNTLEDKYRGQITYKEEKVFGETAINCGIYNIIFSKSTKFKGKLMPELQDVAFFTGVRLHSGNKAEDTEGCILCGIYNESNENWISDSRDTFDELYDKMMSAWNNKEELVIEIKNIV